MSEAARISRMMAEMRNSQIAASVLKAQQIYGTTCNDACLTSGNYQQETPLESDLLIKEISGTCYSFVGPDPPATSSQKTASLIECVLTQSVNPMNPNTRFSVYNGPRIIPACPQPPTEVLNANLPKATTRCIPFNKPNVPLNF